jgi:hypothetical protein
MLCVCVWGGGGGSYSFKGRGGPVMVKLRQDKNSSEAC